MSLFINTSVQKCTIEQFQNNVRSIVMFTEATNNRLKINGVYYNILVIITVLCQCQCCTEVPAPNAPNEVHCNLQCNNSVWEIVGTQPTALRSNTSYDCSDCTKQTVNDYHCTSKFIELLHCILFYLFIDVNHSNINIKSSFQAVTLVEGDMVTLSCAPSVMGTVLWWTHNGSLIQRNSVRMSTLHTSNWNFIIKNVGINASGFYACRDAMDNPVLQQNITVTVLPGD